MTTETVKEHQECAASGAGCHMVHTKRFDQWICEYCGREETESEKAEVAKLSTDTVDVPPEPVTLDDVSRRIDAICEAHLERCKTAQAAYSDDLDALAAAVEASPDINQNAVGLIVLGRVKTLMTEVEKAIG